MQILKNWKGKMKKKKTRKKKKKEKWDKGKESYFWNMYTYSGQNVYYVGSLWPTWGRKTRDSRRSKKLSCIHCELEVTFQQPPANHAIVALFHYIHSTTHCKYL